MLGPVAPARQQAARALNGARRRDAAPEPALLALQRKAGNAAVSALIAGRMRTSGEEAIGRLDAALREIRKDEPAVDTVEKGLREAKAAGVPVDLEGVKPPASALAVTTTGFGPGSVAPKKPVPPPKPVPKKNPLARAASRRTPRRKGAAPARRPAVSGPAGGVAAPPRALSPDQLLQPPVPPTGVRPEQDPAFAAVRSGLVKTGTQARAHPPATAKAKEAQDAAVPPTGDLGAQARAAKVDTMDAQQAGTFDKKAFITAVKAAIEAKSPKTLEEADDYKKSGRAGEVKGEIKGLVDQGTEGQAKDIETAAQAPPDESKAVPKPVTPLAPEAVGQVPAVPATGAAPKPAPPEQTNLQAGKAEADQEMAEGGVTESQLQQSNEPDFQQAVTDKKVAAQHADTAPAQFRKQEQQVIQQGKGEAAAGATSAVTGMRGAKAAAVAGLIADKGKAKSRDEGKRAEVTTKIQGIYATAEKDVKAILDGIDPKVEAEFSRGEASARAEFENYVAAKMSAYKEDRYGGWLGGYRWLRDKIAGMPAKVNEFYAAGRELYLTRMNGVIERVANIVGGDLDRAKKRIAAGRTEIAAYVKRLPADLQKVGSQAAQEIGEKFEALEGEVAAKQEAAVDLLASKYVEARKGLDERIEALQAENKGLVDKAIGAIKAVINTIRQLAAMLRDVLARAAGVVGDIIASPVRFLGNLIDGIKGGILKFKDNIVDHLRKGLMSWLFGALAEGGIELPKSFDLQGIIGFLASLFGLTWSRIRARIAKRIGEPAMDAIETGVEIFQKFRAEGVGGLWQMLVDKLGDIKEMILEQVKDFVVTKIITAGITWLIGLLNPAAAFIKACKLIYDVVMFFVNNAERIKKFVDTVLDSVADVVRGNVGGVIEKVNNVLGQMVPILIGFLASVIGLGGIGQKIREIVEKLQKPITKAIDWVIDKGLKLAGPVLRGLKRVSGFVKGKVAAGQAWVKGKAEAGKKWVKGKAEAAAEKLGILRRPVRLAERNRTLSADLKSGAVVLRTSAADAAPDAGTRTAITAQEQAIRHLTRTGSAARAPVANHLRTIGDILLEAHRRIGQSGPAAAITPPGAPLNANQQRIQQALANPVRRHEANSGLVPRDGLPRTLWLESEHVIPVSWVSIALRLLGQRAINRRGGILDRADDKSMTTVLIYEQASRRKTREEGPIFNALESIIEDEMPRRLREQSKSAAARQLRARTTPADRDLLRSNWEARVGRMHTRLLQRLHGQLSASVERTMRSVITDHAPAKHGVRGHVPPLPQEAHIRRAASLQIEDMARILSERVVDMFPAESAMAETRQDANVREELRKHQQGRGSAPPVGYRQRPSGLYVRSGLADED